MARKPVARLGDTGSHGGAIITGASTFFVNNKPVARVGDIYNCPKHGPNPIVTGAPWVFGEHQPVAHVDSKTACGAIIIEGSPDTFLDAPTQGSTPITTELNKIAPELGNRYFIVVDENDNPIPDAEYIITDANAAEYPGVTDENGRTAIIFGKIGEAMSIQVLTDADDDQSEEV